MKTIDQRIEAIAPYPIDFYQVHQLWDFSNEKAEMEAMVSLVKTIQQLANKSDVTSSQIAHIWLINFHGEGVVAIPGATKESHAKENTGAMTFILDTEDLSLLESKSVLFR